MWTQKLAIIVSVAAFTAACGEAPELNSAQELPNMSTEDVQADDIFVPDDVACDKSDLNGFYQAHLIKRTGNCPDLESFVIQMNDGDMSWGGPCSSEAPAYRAELVRLRHSCKGCLPSFPATTSRATASLSKRTARWPLWVGAGKRLEKVRTGVGL